MYRIQDFLILNFFSVWPGSSGGERAAGNPLRRVGDTVRDNQKRPGNHPVGSWSVLQLQLHLSRGAAGDLACDQLKALSQLKR